jgi:hypothetical protein
MRIADLGCDDELIPNATLFCPLPNELFRALILATNKAVTTGDEADRRQYALAIGGIDKVSARFVKRI